jgi:hypothetical protein
MNDSTAGFNPYMRVSLKVVIATLLALSWVLVFLSQFLFELPVSLPVEHIARPGHQIRADWMWRERAFFHTDQVGVADQLAKPRLVVCDLKLLNTYHAIWWPAAAQVTGIFLMRQHSTGGADLYPAR